ncbi:Pre-mRNA-splicing helicase BRR2 [Rhodotorula toruloides]
MYAGELQGILLALQAVQYTTDASHILISVDNTSALTHSTYPSLTSGQHLRLAVRQMFKDLQRTLLSTQIFLSWSPGHVSIAGNEVADMMAKDAVQTWQSAAREQRKERKTHLKGRLVFIPDMAELSSGSSKEESEWEEGKRGAHLAKSSRLTQLTYDDPLGLGPGTQPPASISALWTAHKQATLTRWHKDWRCSTIGRQLCAVSPLASRSARYHDSLTRCQVTLLCRLRTGACTLNAYGAFFDPSRDPLSVCGKVETREHFLLLCPLYSEARKLLLKYIRLCKPPSIGTRLGNINFRTPLLDFIDCTGQLPQLSSPPEVE